MPSCDVDSSSGNGFDAATIPKEVWNAANLLAERGTDIVRTYTTLVREREELLDTLEVTRTRRMHTTALGQHRLPRTVPGQLLSKPTIEDRLKDTHDWRVAQRWMEQSESWQLMNDRLIRLTGKDLRELTMESGEEWRGKVETLEQLEASAPHEAQGDGGSQWMMTLRNANERYVGVGNIFSGLAMAIKEKKNSVRATTKVRVPHAPGQLTHDASAAATPQTTRPSLASEATPTPTPPFSHPAAHPRSLGARQRAWLDSAYLKDRREDQQERWHALQSHDPETEELQVEGVGLEGTLREVAAREVTMADVEAHLARTDAALLQRYKEALAAAQQQEQVQQDTLLAQLESQKREEAAQQLPYNGPHLEMGADALLFNSCASCSRGGPPASTATATLAVANQGSTAVYYVWWRQPAARLLGAAAAGTGPQRFFLADQKGVMLPGEVKEFTFSFRSEAPGMYGETWQLQTAPQLPLPPLRLRGVAVIEDSSAAATQRVAAELDRREKMTAVTLVINELLTRAAVTRRPRMASQEPPAALAFLANNMTQWPPVYCSARAAAACDSVYKRCRTALTKAAAAAAAAANAALEASKKNVAGAKKKTGEETETVVPFPEAWDGSLDSLAKILAQVEAVDAMQHALLSMDYQQCLRLAETPESHAALTQHALRTVLLEAADQLPAAVSSAQQALPAPAEPAAKRAAATDAVKQTLQLSLDRLQAQMSREKETVCMQLERQLQEMDSKLVQQQDQPEATQLTLWDQFVALRTKGYLDPSWVPSHC